MICKLHNFNYEAFCEVCNQFICSKCIISHSSHSFISLSKVVCNLREQIKQEVKSGKLDKNFTDRRLLEIKETKVQLNNYTNSLIERIEKVFSDLKKEIKMRKESLNSFILNSYNANIEILKDEENKWREKEKTAKQILNLSMQTKDETLFESFDYIVKGLKDLNENVHLKKLKVLFDFENTSKINKNAFIQNNTNNNNNFDDQDFIGINMCSIPDVIAKSIKLSEFTEIEFFS